MMTWTGRIPPTHLRRGHFNALLPRPDGALFPLASTASAPL